MRTVAEVSKDIAAYAPNGGGQWQTVGMRQVPVALLSELREAVDRERRVRTFDYPNAVTAVEAMVPLAGPVDEGWRPDWQYAGATMGGPWLWESVDGDFEGFDDWLAEQRGHVEYAGAWRFDSEC